MAARILVIITARGGSKGVPRKNIRPLGGRPLIAWTIETALAIKDHVARVVVSTDDAEIAAISRTYGAEVPFLRPAELAQDTTKSLPVLQHAVQAIEQQDGSPVDWVLLLQPTTPFRSAEDIIACLDFARAGDCDSVISVAPSPVHPIFVKSIDDEGFLRPFLLEEPEGLRRQDAQPPAYVRNGAVYLTRRDVLMETNSIWGRRIKAYVMPPERSVNIDSEADFLLAETLAERLMPAACAE